MYLEVAFSNCYNWKPGWAGTWELISAQKGPGSKMGGVSVSIIGLLRLKGWFWTFLSKLCKRVPWAIFGFVLHLN